MAEEVRVTLIGSEVPRPGLISFDGQGAKAPTPAPPRPKPGPLSKVAQRGKIAHFLPMLPKDALILDVGCAAGWFQKMAAARGYTNVIGVDLVGPADIVGDIMAWRDLGLTAHSFDAIFAFEVIEHGDFSLSFHELLKPDGRLFLTTPLPAMDPVCKVLEALRLLQRRTSPHDNLIDLRRFPRFEVIERRIKAGISQWGVLRPLPLTGPGNSAAASVD